MILQSLTEYYDRSDSLAPEGWEWKRIQFVIELGKDGHFVQLSDMRRGPKSGDIAPSLVPKAEIRSGPKAFERPNALWDHYGFVLGAPKSDKASDIDSAKKQFRAFCQRIEDFQSHLPNSPGLRAIADFYAKREYERVKDDPLWAECVKIPGCNLTFRLAGENEIVAHEAPVRQMLMSNGIKTGTSEDDQLGVCLVTGDRLPIQKLHFPIAGVCEKPAPLSSINNGACPSFASFGKDQGLNFPVSKASVFRYTTALNHLLRPGSRNRFRIGDAVTVFWAQKPDEIEDAFAAFFGEGDDPDARIGQVRALLESIQNGKFDGARGENRFYVLGLAPNAARISVRFWHAAPLHEIAERTRAWFDLIAMVRGPIDPEFPSLFRLLAACAVQGKADNIPPNLGGDVMRSILSGAVFPATWLSAAVQRCRAEQRVTYLRAAAIKACLNRGSRHDATEKEFQPMLDTDNPNTAYRLGRLFAVLEKIQEEASPGLNTTIRERYYGAASSTPVTVFTTLLRLKNHHLAKLESRGRAVNFEKLIGGITQGVADFPAHLGMPDQGRFALGYYHQRQNFFTKSESTDKA